MFVLRDERRVACFVAVLHKQKILKLSDFFSFGEGGCEVYIYRLNGEVWLGCEGSRHQRTDLSPSLHNTVTSNDSVGTSSLRPMAALVSWSSSRLLLGVGCGERSSFRLGHRYYAIWLTPCSLQTLLRLQKRARIILQKKIREDRTANLYCELGWVSLPERWNFHKSLTVSKVHLTPKFFFGRDETLQHSHREFHNIISVWYF